jgi:hypothetical protein
VPLLQLLALPLQQQGQQQLGRPGHRREAQPGSSSSSRQQQ